MRDHLRNAGIERARFALERFKQGDLCGVIETRERIFAKVEIVAAVAPRNLRASTVP
jgi:hypothetical protein